MHGNNWLKSEVHLTFFISICNVLLLGSLKFCLDSSPGCKDCRGGSPSSWPECPPRPSGFAGRFRIEGTAEVGRGHRGLDTWLKFMEACGLKGLLTESTV